MPINLASRPFENRRPVVRVKWLLLALGALTWGVAGVKYWDYAAGSSEETRAQLQAVDAEIADLGRNLSEIEDALARAELEQRNQRMLFLNAKLGERAFPWSRLFQDLSTVQPWYVRLHRVTPSQELDEVTGLPGQASLSLDGSAKTREAWYRFVDRLFQHPRFYDPQMLSEDVDEGEVNFRLNVQYRTALDPQAEPASGEGAAAVAAGGGA